MDYSEEEVYLLVGKQDKISTVTFKSDSDSFKLYGQHVTVLFVYTQYEREELDKRIENPKSRTAATLKVKHFTSHLDNDRVRKLEETGINSYDIASILYFKHDTQNTFHSKEKRAFSKIKVPLYVKPKGKDFDWMYGFSKQLVENDIGVSPKEKQFYLAGKLYYEPDLLTPDEHSEIFIDSKKMKTGVEFEYLKIKYGKGEAVDIEKKRLLGLFREKDIDDMDLLDKYLKETGSSLSKLAREDLELATKLLVRVSQFQERHFNVVGKKAIYLDVDRYLHVYMRHVEEMKVNKHFGEKSNFQCSEEDVLLVIDNVIDLINDEIQDFFQKNPRSRFSKYGRQSVYFEGDYYTIHIESNGTISTFYRNWKEQEQC